MEERWFVAKIKAGGDIKSFNVFCVLVKNPRLKFSLGFMAVRRDTTRAQKKKLKTNI